jgi:hypothetical protein
MSALAFVSNLLDSGRVRVPSARQAPERLDEAVRELDRLARAELAFDAPPLAPAAGEWALLLLYRACQALVYREIEPDAVKDALSRPCPVAASPEVCYSVDLAFRFMPELTGLARGIAENDPLVAGLLALAKAWPLSSVGVKGVGDVTLQPFIRHPALKRLYADRVIEKADVSRLCDPAAREAVREALGAFPHLAPAIAVALEEEKQTCP